MAEIVKSCDIVQGFDFKKDRHAPAGFITRMTLGGVQLAADLTVRNPLNPSAALSVVAVLTEARWGGRVTDPVELSGQVSEANRLRVANMLTIPELPEFKVPFSFAVYEYDPVAQKYFKCLHTGDAELQGIVAKSGGALNFSVAADASTDVQLPVNFAFWIGIKPQAIAQTIGLASGANKKWGERWGAAG